MTSINGEGAALPSDGGGGVVSFASTASVVLGTVLYFNHFLISKKGVLAGTPLAPNMSPICGDLQSFRIKSTPSSLLVSILSGHLRYDITSEGHCKTV